MLTPEDAMYLRLIEDRSRELHARKEDASTREGADELQAQINELNADYEKIVAAAVLI